MRRLRLIFIELKQRKYILNLLVKSNSDVNHKMPDKLEVKFIEMDFSVSELGNKIWETAENVKIIKYWSGAAAPNGRHFEAKLLWSDSAFYVRFSANQYEPLVVSEKPDLEKKTRGLWDRDVCEIFLAPNEKKPRNYFEFEVAPTGEWIDLKINQKPDGRTTDWDYNSGMKTAAQIGKDAVIMSIKVEWKAFNRMPKAGDIWLGNILRAVGKGETRGYLAWSPTETDTPNFHVPEKFGMFEFLK